MKYTTSFSSIVKPITSAEKDKYLALASLDQLRAFIPGIDLEKNHDLLAVAFNACVVNRVNANDDLTDTDTALAVADLFINKPVNIEHRRKAVVGTIINVGFSEFGTDKPLTREELKGTTKPFNIVLGAVIWRVVSDDLADIIEASNDPTSEHYLKVSASWELGFDKYDLLVLPDGEKNLEAGKRISDPQQVELLSAQLRALGGEGKINKGERVYRLVHSSVLPLGIGLTANPAADVEGVAVAKGEAESICASGHFINKCSCGTVISQCRCPGQKTETIVEKGCEQCKSKENISQSIESSVSNNSTIMDKKISTLNEITDELLKEVKASTIHQFVQSELEKACLEHAKKTEEANSALTVAEEARKALAAEYETLKKTVAELTEKLGVIAAEQAATAEAEKFSARMSKFDEAYNLTDADRKVIASQIKGLSDEAFAEYENNAAILMKEKSKAKAQEAIASVEDKKEAAVTDVVDSAVDNAKKDATLPNTSTAAEPSFQEKFSKHFAYDQFEISDNKRRKV